MKNIVCFTLLSFLFFSIACGNKEERKDHRETGIDRPVVFVPDFNADSAYAYVETQVAFGPRVPNTEAHKACALWLKEKLSSFCDEVVMQEVMARAYNNKVLNGYNIIGSFNPEARKRILLCAHWDSRPYADHDPDPANHRKPIDGANDGASGVGVLLETARQMSQHKPNIGVDIIFFDLEDYGEPQGTQYNGEYWALGSQHWAKSPHSPGYHANFGILLDMVGAPDATFYMEGTSMYFAPQIMRKVWNTAHKLGYNNYFIKEESSAITDDHLYINQIAKIPTINIIHRDPETPTGFFKYWHTVKDNIEHIDPATLNVVGKIVLKVVYNEK